MIIITVVLVLLLLPSSNVIPFLKSAVDKKRLVFDVCLFLTIFSNLESSSSSNSSSNDYHWL